jgi:HPt (histidine-containing phosphotransfer) domain-containing protein
MIDWTRVDELVSEIGPDDFGDVVELFLEEVDTAMNGLCTSENLQNRLHLIKGCAWNLGFTALGQICAAEEAAGGLLSQNRIEYLRETYAKSRAAFMEGLSVRSISAPAA